MDFALSEEQQMLFDMAKSFTENELIPHEDLIEDLGELPRELEMELRKKAMDVGLHACNMPEKFGGAELDCVSFTLVEKALEQRWEDTTSTFYSFLRKGFIFFVYKNV